MYSAEFVMHEVERDSVTGILQDALALARRTRPRKTSRILSAAPASPVGGRLPGNLSAGLRRAQRAEYDGRARQSCGDRKNTGIWCGLASVFSFRNTDAERTVW